MALVAVLPTLSFALEKLSTYNGGANCNASGVAVLLDVAARVAASRDIPDGDEPLIHGAAAAASAGLVPEGTELVYDVPSNTDELDSSMESAAERLAAAKAAVAALSGKPVDETEAVTSPASDPEEEAPAPACPDPAPALEAEPPTASPVIVPVQAPAPAVEPTVPDWFKKGQEQAKKPKVEKPVKCKIGRASCRERV